MNQNILDILCTPDTREGLELADVGDPSSTALIDPTSGQRFPLRDGIPIFVKEHEVSGDNAKYLRLYNRIARFYDLATKLYAFVKSSGEKNRRSAYLSQLEIKGRDRVLEVSIGTGGNIRFLSEAADYFGLDISWGMLQQCRRNMRKLGRKVELFCGTAEKLPFKDEVFNVVFHVGGINYFNDRAKALEEMIRVAKPGTKMIVVDETEKFARKFERTPGASDFYRDREDRIAVPVDLLPPGMLEVDVQTVANGDLYCLSFRKPAR